MGNISMRLLIRHRISVTDSHSMNGTNSCNLIRLFLILTAMRLSDLMSTRTYFLMELLRPTTVWTEAKAGTCIQQKIYDSHDLEADLFIGMQVPLPNKYCQEDPLIYSNISCRHATAMNQIRMLHSFKQSLFYSRRPCI